MAQVCHSCGVQMQNIGGIAMNNRKSERFVLKHQVSKPTIKQSLCAQLELDNAADCANAIIPAGANDSPLLRIAALPDLQPREFSFLRVFLVCVHVLCVVLATSALGFSICSMATGSLTSSMEAFGLGLPLFALWGIYAITIICQLGPSRGKIFKQAIVPFILSNCAIAWGSALGLYTLVLQAIERCLPHNVWAVALALGLLTTGLVGAIVLSMVSFSNLNKTVAEACARQFGAQLSIGGAKYTGLLIGLIIGLDGLYISLSCDSNNMYRFFGGGTLIWALAVLVSLMPLSEYRRLVCGKRST